MKLPASIQRWGLIRIFAFFSLISILTLSAGSAYIFYSFLRDNLQYQEMVISSEFIQGISLINNHEGFFSEQADAYDRHEIEEFLSLISSMPDIFRVIAYDREFKILWASDKHLEGKVFTDNEELQKALAGKHLFEQVANGDPIKQEHQSIPEHVELFVESYHPVWDSNHREIIGVLEIYKYPRTLYQAIKEARVLVIVVTLMGAIILYWVLFWIVLTAHRLIESQRTRIKQATSRAVELNEQNMRRIGSDMHDGPAQSIGYALLRLDSLRDCADEARSPETHQTFDKIEAALNDALREIRDLSAGLVIPELDDLPFKEFLLKLIEKHEMRTSTRVDRKLDELPSKLKPSLKICIYRLIQEGLNNACKHGKGIKQSVRIVRDAKLLQVIVSDGGPGMRDSDFQKINDSDHLGLRGLRERVESLGGIFAITNGKHNTGVVLQASLPLGD